VTQCNGEAKISDPIERLGKNLLQQQLALCEEWRKANPDTVRLPVLLCNWEVRDFKGADERKGVGTSEGLVAASEVVVSAQLGDGK
jgi:hypothetical protein